MELIASCLHLSSVYALLMTTYRMNITVRMNIFYNSSVYKEQKLMCYMFGICVTYICTKWKIHVMRSEKAIRA